MQPFCFQRVSGRCKDTADLHEAASRVQGNA